MNNLEWPFNLMADLNKESDPTDEKFPINKNEAPKDIQAATMIEIIKKGDPKKIESWERIHDRRKTYRCERCGCEWKCEYKDNKFGSAQEYNGDPDILCQECGRPTVKEVKTRKIPEREV